LTNRVMFISDAHIDHMLIHNFLSSAAADERGDF